MKRNAFILTLTILALSLNACDKPQPEPVPPQPEPPQPEPDVPSEDGYYLVGPETDWKFAGAVKMDAGTGTNKAQLLEYVISANQEFKARSYIDGVDTWYTYNGGSYVNGPYEITANIYVNSANKLVVKEPEFSFDLFDYEMNDGYSKEDLQGAPWIDANIPGQAEMIKQPSVKDDFYTAVNYDDLVYGNPGPFDVSSQITNTALNSVINGTAVVPNYDFIAKTRDLISSGATATVKNYLDNLNINDYASSKEIFYGVCGILRFTCEDGVYHIQFNDGYNTDVYGYQTLAYYGYYSQWYSDYEVYNTYAINIAKAIYNALGYTSSTSNTMASTGHTYFQKLLEPAIYQQLSSYTPFTTVDSVTIPGLKSALLDAGLSLDDEVSVDSLSYTLISNFYNALQSEYASSYAYAIKNLIAVEYRHLIGAANYKPLSKTLSEIGVFGDDDVSQSNDTVVRNKLMTMMLNILIEKDYLYLQADENVKNTVAQIIEDVLAAYKEMINNVDWIKTKTRDAIIKKLDYMKYTSCYSDKIKNFPEISENGLNTMNLFDIFNRYHETIIQATVDDNFESNPTLTSSSMHSYTVNAFYSPNSNQFVILNGILPGGFIGDSVELNYARVGSVIGHEISHAFDSTGALFNENGEYNQNGWWNTLDMARFKNKVNQLVEFYDKINLYDDVYVNGENVDGEATADFGGVQVMLQLAKNIEGFDYDLFFRNYASLWMELYNQSYLPYYIQDEHPFPYLRVNVTLAQFDEFVMTYDLKAGDGMYIPKAERVKIW